MTLPATTNGTGIRVTIGAGVTVFLICSVFWAGATYNRVEGIETQLGNIQAQLAKIGNFQILEERSIADQKRIDKLEESVFKLETDNKFK